VRCALHLGPAWHGFHLLQIVSSRRNLTHATTTATDDAAFEVLWARTSAPVWGLSDRVNGSPVVVEEHWHGGTLRSRQTI
jgi:hypothetical protein